MLGLNGIVVKSHGSADAIAFASAIGRAYEAAHSHLIERLKASLEGMALSIEANTAADIEP
jgi:glycerol-3-phosphate acyltransferase PlsX